MHDFFSGCRASDICQETGVTEELLRNVLSVVEQDWLGKKTGRRRELWYCPEDVQDESHYRDLNESEEDWIRRRDEMLYQNIQILRTPASNYYRKHRKELSITEMQWKAIVLHSLEYIRSHVDMYLKEQGVYRPYFLSDQLPEMAQLESRAKEAAELFLRLNKVWKESPFLSEMTLPNSLKKQEQAEHFSQAIYKAEELLTPFEAGLLFLMRTNMHPLFGGRRSSSALENISGVDVEKARQFFDRIQSEMEGCLAYSEIDLISWRPSSYRIHLDELVRDKDYQQLRSQVCLALEESLKKNLKKDKLRSKIKRYGKKFFSPIYPQNKNARDKFEKILQYVVENLDWSEIPVDSMWDKIRCSKTAGKEVLQRHLVEYACVQQLIQKGYENLGIISCAVFRSAARYRP